MKARQLWWIGAGIVLFLLPEIAGGRRLGGMWLEAWSYPLWAFIHDRIWSGSLLPMWQPYVDCGLSLVGSPSVGLCYPLNWLVWLFTPSTALPLSIALHMMLAGCGAALLLYKLGCRWSAAVSAGLAVAVGGVLPELAARPERLQVLAWWPWLLLALEDEKGWWAALIVGLQSLCGDPQGVLLSGVGATAWCLVRHADRQDSLTTLSRLSSVFMLGVCLGAVSWLPYADTYRHSLRYAGGLPNPPHLALHLLLSQMLPVVPLTALALALLALAERKHFGQVMGSTWAVVLAALIGARGLAGPVGWLSSWLLARAAAITDPDHHIAQVVVSLLGRGVAAVAGDEPLRWLGLVGLALLIGAGVGLNRFFAHSEQLGWSVALLHVLVCGLMGRLVLPTAHGPWPADPDALALLKPISDTNFRYCLAGQPDPRLFDDGTLRQARDAVGFAPMAPADTMDVLNWAARHRVVDADHDRPELLTNGHRVLGPPLQDTVLGCLGVKLALDGASPTAALHLRTLEHTRERAHLADHWTVYPRGTMNGLGLATMSEEGEPTSDDLNPEMLGAMSQSQPSNEVLLDQHPDVGDTAEDDPTPLTGDCSMIEDQPDRVVVQVTSSRKALLVLADAYDEGWIATVNGEPHRVYPADGMLRAVVVPAGQSRVEWRYVPPSWNVALLLSLGSLGMWGVMGWREHHREATAPPAPPPSAVPPATLTVSVQATPPPPARTAEKPAEDAEGPLQGA